MSLPKGYRLVTEEEIVKITSHSRMIFDARLTDLFKDHAIVVNKRYALPIWI